jgi:hypothetical protein
MRNKILSFEDEIWMELAQDRVHWPDFVPAVLQIRVMLPEN